MIKLGNLKLKEQFIHSLYDLGGSGGASSKFESGQELRIETFPSVGVVIECLSNRGDGGLVKERSLVCVGLGGKGTSQQSPSLQNNYL